VLACVAGGVLATPAPAAAAPSARAAGLQRQLDALVAAGVPGAILLTRDGKTSRRYASGLAQVQPERSMRAGDRFRIASLTKSYTATVVLQLVAEDRLALSDSVESRLPGVVPGGAGITIRQLLDHTSGLFDHERDPRVLAPYLSGNFGHYWEPRALVDMAVSHPPLFAPGTQQSYSNTNYVVAQLIVEAVTGRPLGVELERRIFKPLKLRATSYPLTPEIPGRHAHGYLVVGQPPATDVTGISPSISPGSGAIIATARDVAAFYGALLGGRLLERAQLRAMKQTLPVGGGGDIPGQRYGLGVGTFPTRCGVAWGHNGAQPGYMVFAYTSGGGRRGAVLMTNLSPSSMPAAAGRRFYALIESAFCRGS
jgi:D-alanyl-D-alanine carboxypeptidase